MPAVLFFSVFGVYFVCRDSGGAIDSLVALCTRISYGMLFAVGFWSSSVVLRRWMSEATEPLVPRFSGLASTATIGTTALRPPTPLSVDLENTQPAQSRYRVRGYDRDPHFQTIEFVYADSPSNAQMKVELKGVEVAAVEAAA
jgi:hypothetical protein